MPDFICPYCKHVNTLDDADAFNYVTYWGEGEPNERSCDSCERAFLVVEVVTRTYETRPKGCAICEREEAGYNVYVCCECGINFCSKCGDSYNRLCMECEDVEEDEEQK